MIRLTLIQQSPSLAVVKLEGDLIQPDLPPLIREGQGYLRQCEHLVLDLSGVGFIDDAGLALLDTWKGKKLVLVGASKFVRALLKSRGL